MPRTRWLLLWPAFVSLAACGGTTTPVETPESPGETLTDVRGEQTEPDRLPFDDEAAQNVLRRGAKKAEQCAQVTPDATGGEGDVQVVFDGPKGKVVDVVLGPPFSGGPEQFAQCVRNAFLGEIIPPFDEAQKSVPYTVNIPAPAAP
ncbi:MAG: hypothetical protein HY744_24215 [Deltaproteobacteria bacterium]|nr:hypothetical protein [Deltaproteobacteria bacterium]